MKPKKLYNPINKKNNIPIRYLKKILFINADGILCWTSPKMKRLRPGTPAGSIRKKDGYSQVKITYKGRAIAFLTHRVVFAMSHNRWPVSILDHIDRNRLNNKIENLREVDTTQNCSNISMRKDNTSGHKNIYILKNRFRVIIARYGKTHEKSFGNLEEAIKHRDVLLSLIGF